MQKASITFILEEQSENIGTEILWQPDSAQGLEALRKLFNKEKVYLLVFLVTFFFLPPFIFWAVQTPKLFNYIAFGAVFFSLVGYASFGKFSLHELGFRLDTLKSSLLTYVLFSGGVSILLYILYLGQWFHHSQQGSAPNLVFLLFYIFLASPAQEYIYRGVLFAEMKRRGLHQAWLQILISGCSFGFLHMYHYDYYTVGVTLVMGLAWSVLYQKHPNILYVTLSHMLLGTIAILIRMV